ncbi:MAG TPA: alpha/beta hydrolase, partial [Candidatus Polarisedimenticolia bacterium]|nr:alpha/beta hydrolase [Candidatus Polarisedimenticolia bacterium]
MRHRIAIETAALVVLFSVVFCQCALAGKQPPLKGETAAKPPQDPGSGGARHGKVDKKMVGDGSDGYWLFLPDDPTPKEAPVVLFLHGWRGTNPHDYGGWIDHIVRRGNIVIYPIYESGSFSEEPEKMMESAIKSTKAAIESLKKSGSVKPQLDQFAIVGHSLGGGLTAQIAARAEKAGLPVPKALMPSQPGWRGGDTIPVDKLSQIPATALVLVVVGDEDQFGKTRQGKPIFAALGHIPKDHKRYVIIPTDNHGNPPLLADHSSPLSPRDDYGKALTSDQERRRKTVGAITGMREGVVDALDFNGYWKLFDSLCDAAFAGRTIDAVIGSPEQLSLGKWSDGTPVKP